MLPGSSVWEVRLRCELGRFFTTEHDKRRRVVRLDGKRYDPDIMLSDIHVLVEADSVPWHEGAEEHDRLKTVAMSQAGWTVIRVRRAPLEALSSLDVCVSQTDNVHSITVAILERISELRGQQVPDFLAYRSGGRETATSEADARIDALDIRTTPGERRRRVVALTALFKGESWRKFGDGVLASLAPDTITERVSALDTICRGRHWLHAGGLLLSDPASLQAKETELDEIFGGRKWLDHLGLLGADSGRLTRNAALLDALFNGRRWTSKPRLLASRPETLAATAAVLDEIYGDRRWTQKLSLLGYSPKTLRAKTEELDTLFGGRHWRRNPGLLSLNLESVRAKAVLLAQLVDGDGWRHMPHLFSLSALTLQRRFDRLVSLIGEENARIVCQRSSFLTLNELKLARWIELRFEVAAASNNLSPAAAATASP
jgi:hypothetical protein